MFGLIAFFIFFQIFFGMVSGGIPPRIMYAATVSSGFMNFLQNYALSYQITYDQIHSTEEYLTEVNSKLEKLLAFALEDYANVELTSEKWDGSGRILRIQKPQSFPGRGGIVRFYMDSGKIDGNKFALSPTVFILAEKVCESIKNQEKLELRNVKQKAI